MAKRQRRAKGEGSIFQSKNGEWRGYITIGYKPTGEQIKKWRYGKTEAEVRKKLRKIANLASSRIINAPQSYTLEEWLRHFSELRAPGIRPSSRNAHTYYINIIVPHLGTERLTKISRHRVQQFYTALVQQDLGISVRRHVHHFLKAALDEAYYHDAIVRNPAEGIVVPLGKPPKKAQTWQPSHIKAFLETARGDRFYAYFYLALTNGLRPGEALALRWDDLMIEEELLKIDETLGRVSPNQEYKPSIGPPKTQRSNRTIALSRDTLEVLLEHRRLQIEEQGRSKRWEDHGLIFPTTQVRLCQIAIFAGVTLFP